MAVPPPAPGDAHRYAALVFTAHHTVQQRKEALNDVRFAHPAALGFSVTTDAGTRYFRFNRGTASTMTVPSDARDASLHPSSRLVGIHGEEIIAPTFVNLGHELGHVVRSLHGIGGSSADATALVRHAFPGAGADMRTEEFFNIDAVENRIRAEAELSRREGHTNWVGRELVRLHDAVELALLRAERAVAPSPHAFRARLEQFRDEHARMLVSLAKFGKRGGDPAGIDAQAATLAQLAADLEAAVLAQGPVLAPPPAARIRPPDTAYLLLGLAPGASHAEARAAYKRLALRWHPDRNLGDEDVAQQRFSAIRAAYDQINDWTSGGAVEEPKVLAIQRTLAPRLQRLSVDDRRWSEVSSVAHLGANAFELSTAEGESVVVKRSGKGLLAFDPGDEGPVQETLAAKLGEIAGLGVTTARTVMIGTRGDEGQYLLAHLRGLGSVGLGLADDLAGTDVILVMQRAPGTRADRAAKIIAESTRGDRIRLFSRLGRLWAFDVLINNTDRIHIGNWGNVVLGPGGSVVGIDQMIGLLASDTGAEFARDEAASKLKIALDPGKRRDFAHETFRSLCRHLGPEFAMLEGLFVMCFELGALKGIDAIAGMDPSELTDRKAELPGFAQDVADEIGLGGAAVIQGVFAEFHSDIAKQLTAVREEIAAREHLALSTRGDVAEARGRRSAILKELGAQASALAREWTEVDTWWTGKDAHWTKRGTELVRLRDFGFKDFMEAGRIASVKREATVNAQIEDWAEGLKPVWEAANKLAEPLKSAHSTIKPLIVGLVEAVRQERRRVPLLERM
ncbi:MAG: DnaJ domain-containing protein [Solirubrobacteraceae bacterium]